MLCEIEMDVSLPSGSTLLSPMHVLPMVAYMVGVQRCRWCLLVIFVATVLDLSRLQQVTPMLPDAAAAAAGG